MIKQKLKKCRICGKEVYLFSRGRCKPCTIKEDKYKISKENRKQYIKRKLYSNLRLDYLEIHKVCEVCLTNPAIEIHHKSGRIGDNLFKNFLAVCRTCHMWIHNNVKESMEKGYLLLKGN